MNIRIFRVGNEHPRARSRIHRAPFIRALYCSPPINLRAGACFASEGSASPRYACAVGAGNPVTSRDLGVFVDLAAEPVPPQDLDIRAHDRRMLADRES